MASRLSQTILKLAVYALKRSRSNRAQPSAPAAPKKPALSTPRAMALGAGLMVAGRTLASPRGREMIGWVRECVEEARGPDRQEAHDADDPYDEEPEAERHEDYDDYDEDEPYDEEREGEGDEDEPEPEPRRRSRSGGVTAPLGQCRRS